MSSASQAHDAHDAHDAHSFTGEPANELPPDETPTPGWLPVLGVVLFTAFGVVVLAERAQHMDQPGADVAAAAATASGVPVPVAPPPAMTVTPRVAAQPGAPRPTGTAQPRKIDPAQIDAIRRAQQGSGPH